MSVKDRSTVTCTRVDPDVLRTGKGLVTAMRKADRTQIDQSVFTARAEARREAAGKRRFKKK